MTDRLFHETGADETPLVSVIVPVYNVEEYVAECLDSILSQTYRNIEILCVNDQSADRSPDILAQYRKKDDRIRIINNRENRGLSFSRNAGLLEASGEYVLFIDSDDHIDPDTVEKCVESADKDQTDLVVFSMVNYEEDGGKEEQLKLLSKYDAQKVYSGNEILYEAYVNKKDWPVNAVLCLYRRSFLAEHGITFVEGILHEDNLFSYLCLKYSQRIRLLPIPFYHRRIRSNSIITSTHNLLHKTESMCVIVAFLKEELRKEDQTVDERILTELLRAKLKILLAYYLKIDSFPKDFKFRFKESYIEIISVSAGLYNGYLPLKLTPEDMALLRSNDNVLIYGSGKTGQAVAKLLTERDIQSYRFVVTHNDGDRENVSMIDDVKEDPQNTVVIIASLYHGKEMEENARKNGYAKFIHPYF